MSTPRKTKIAVIREEYVAITAKFEHALILNQLIYWTERVKDFDQFIEEENKRKDDHGLQEEMQELTHGWIYKTAQQLADELMTGWSPATTGRHLKDLVDQGYIEVRQNPKYKWNQTRQYRVNLNLVGQTLYEKGYSIPGYALIQHSKDESPVFKMKSQKSDLKSVPIIETINKDYDVPPQPDPAPIPLQISESSFSQEDLQTLSEAVPEARQSKQVDSRLTKALIAGFTVAYLLDCITYSDDKNPKNFLSYLGNCIDKGYAPEGYHQATEEARRKQKENAVRQEQAQQEDDKEKSALETHNERVNSLLEQVDIQALDEFIGNQDLSQIERQRCQQGKMPMLRRKYVIKFSEQLS